MLLGLDNKVAIVTGASKGIGNAISFALAKEGAHVCMVARTSESLEKAAKEIQEKTGREIIHLSGDTSDPNLPGTVLGEVLKRWGAVHILVNNTGGPPLGSFLEHADDIWASTFNRNLMSVIRFSKTVVPHMKKQTWGKIINISSTIAKEPTPQMVLSATARAGVSAFSKAIAAELAPYRITVNTICPGGVLTDRLTSLFAENARKQEVSYDELIQKSQASIPINRFATPDEIANVVIFLASEQSSYLTGTSIMVDGGLTKSVF